MQPDRLKRLRGQLFNRLPLIGGWMRRQAAQALVADGSPAALQTLALALTHTSDENIHQEALRALEQAHGGNQATAICQAWAETRHPALGSLIIRKGWVARTPPSLLALSALLTSRLELITQGKAELVAPLLAACQDADPQLAQRATACLEKLEEPEAVDEFCRLWAESRQPDLEKALVKAAYIARSPLPVRVRSALKNRQPQALHAAGAPLVEALLQAADDPDPAIAGQARTLLGELTHPEAQEAACQRLLQEDHPILHSSVLRGGYAPRDPLQRALFFFLTGQWERYASLDFDWGMLRAFYETAQEPLRGRILNRIRSGGRADLLAIIASGDRPARLQRMEASEFRLLVQVLIQQGEWGRLWQNALQLPLYWSLQAMHALASSGWQPEREGERRLFAELAPLSSQAAFQAAENLSAQIPPAVRQARARLTQGRINDVAFSPRRPVLALGVSRRKVALWDFQRAAIDRIIGGLEHSIGEVAFTRQDRLLFAERTNSSAVCALYTDREGSALRLLEQPASITALEPVGESQALAAGRNHTVILLDPDLHPPELGQKKIAYWPRAACIAHSQEHAALLHEGITLLNLPDLQAVRQTGESRLRGVARCAAFFPDGLGLFAGKHNGEVLVLRGRKLIVDPTPLVIHAGRVEGVFALTRHPLVVSASSDGSIHFTPFPSEVLRTPVQPAPNRPLYRLFGRRPQPAPLPGRHPTPNPLVGPGDQITSMHLSPDESFMALGHSDSSISLWDLRPLDLPEMIQKPLALATPDQMAAIQALADHPEFTPAVRQALNFASLVLQFRFRFDIEIDALPAIQVGEFDIEID